MKKYIYLTLLGLIAAILVAIPAVPYLIGIKVEDRFRLEHTTLQSEAVQQGYDIELVDYQRHPFKATATTRITMNLPKSDKIYIEFKHKIRHSPKLLKLSIATVDSELVLNGKAAEVINPLFKDEAPLTTYTTLFLDGHQEATIYSPSASGTLAGSGRTTIEWYGLLGSAWQSADIDQIKLKVEVPKLDFYTVKDSIANSINFTNLSHESDMIKGDSTMWGGTSKFDIASIAAKFTDQNRDKTTINIEAINVQGEQSETNGLAKGSAVIKSKRISVNEFTLTDLNYDVAVENIDAKAMLQLQKELQKMARDTKKSADPIQPLLAHLPALYNAHPVIKINDLSVSSPEGQFKLTMDIRNSGVWDDTFLQAPQKLASMVEVNIDTSVPRSTVEMMLKSKVQEKMKAREVSNNLELNQQDFEAAVDKSINQQIEGIIGMGFVKTNKGQLESKLQYNAGKLIINGVDASQFAGSIVQ